jgi:nucleotide-binding universal stress UspA family protein
MRFRPTRILCATDLSDTTSSVAVAHAARLARKFAGRVYLCHVADLTPATLYESPRLVLTTLEEIRHKAEEQILACMKDQGVDWEPLLLEGHPGTRIAEIAEEIDAHIVVVATHGRGALQRFFLGSVTNELLHTLKRPLLIVRERGPGGRVPVGRELELEKIVVGCDFSADAELALSYASSLAQELQAELCLLHVLEPLAYQGLTPSTKALAEDLRGAVRSAVEGRLASLVDAEARNWARVRTAIASGKPSAEIIQFAEREGADLIVVGSSGMGPIGRLIVGSTAEAIVRHATLPVLVVREPEARRGRKG